MGFKRPPASSVRCWTLEIAWRWRPSCALERRRALEQGLRSTVRSWGFSRVSLWRRGRVTGLAVVSDLELFGSRDAIVELASSRLQPESDRPIRTRITG